MPDSSQKKTLNETLQDQVIKKAQGAEDAQGAIHPVEGHSEGSTKNAIAQGANAPAPVQAQAHRHPLQSPVIEEKDQEEQVESEEKESLGSQTSHQTHEEKK